jgi:hypothetical protein
MEYVPRAPWELPVLPENAPVPVKVSVGDQWRPDNPNSVLDGCLSSMLRKKYVI